MRRTARRAVVEFLSSQPLLPRWRLRVVELGGRGYVDDLQVADVDVVDAPVRPPVVPRQGRSSGLVVVLDSAADAVGWGGVGSLVLVDDPPEHLARAVEEAAQGRVWVSERVAPVLPKVVASGVPAAVAAPAVALTLAESATLELLLDGRSNAQIAAVRKVSVNTVKSCVRQILRKHGCSRREDLFAALRG